MRDNVTADWARRNSNIKILEDFVKREINMCLDKIEASVGANVFKCSICEIELHESTIEELERRGFKVKFYSANDGTELSYYLVTW